MTRGTTLHKPMGDEYRDYLFDESRRIGCADSISFPGSENDIIEQLAWAREDGIPVTVQCGLTGIAGGATPNGGHILNLSRMDRVLGMRRDNDGAFFVTVEPGHKLSVLRAKLANKEFDSDGWSLDSKNALAAFCEDARVWVFPPDLTEASACIGGVVANNGSGARSFKYGPARPHVSALRIILIDGDFITIKRGDHFATGRSFALTTDGGNTLRGELPTYAMPDVKNAAGFYAKDDMDLIDMFVGSEGVLGIFSEIELRLSPAPLTAWGITSFFPGEKQALDYVVKVRDNISESAAIEFFSSEALLLLRRMRAENAAFEELPDLHDEWHTAVYVELHGDDAVGLEAALESLSGHIEACGGDPDATWFAESAHDIERFKGVRHAVPEAVNLLIGERKKELPELTKLGTDLSVPDDQLHAVMGMYHDDLNKAGLEYVIFGHVGNNHLHVNILPGTIDQYKQGKLLYLEWARRVVEMGGSVSAEHGIGKLKTEMLKTMYGDNGIEEMRTVKRIFDPDGRLNRDTLFEWIA